MEGTFTRTRSTRYWATVVRGCERPKLPLAYPVIRTIECVVSFLTRTLIWFLAPDRKTLRLAAKLISTALGMGNLERVTNVAIEPVLA